MTINYTLQSNQNMHIYNLSRLYAGDKLPQCFSIAGNYAGYYGDNINDVLDNWCINDMPAIINELLLKGADPVSFHPLIIEFAPLGVHFVDALFGAKVYRQDGQIWNELLPGGLADLKPVNIKTSPLIQWTMQALGKLLQEIPEEIAVTGPIFSSPLNVAINLFGEDALMDFLDPNSAVLQGLDIITDAISDLHKSLISNFPANRIRFYCSSTRYAPDGFGHICGCSTQLLGTDTYKNIIAPCDARILSIYPNGGTIHLCGHHTQHLQTWREMPLMRAVQLNDTAADDFYWYFHHLRPDQIIYIGPTENMPFEKILDISKGERVIIQAQME